ncbi:MAG: hypothetical protein NTU53_06755 [Planctomycetota bacterium]|nr:hypothetical protein [Planctomycetota bacterium]
MGTNLMRAAVVVSAICWAAGVAQGDAGWVGQPYSVSIPTHINSINQAVSASTDITLHHDDACDIAVSVALAGDEVLTSSGRTLTTAYMLTGTDLSIPDGAWVASATFITKTYHVLGTGPNSTITLSVQATPPSNQAPDAGTYTGSITLTASW